MAVSNKIQNSFTAGELDPKLRARNDIAVFYTGAAKLRNVLPIPQGAVKRRPGLEYVTDIDSGNVKLYDFPYSGDTSYLMVLTENKMRIYKGGTLVSTETPTVSDAQVRDCTFAHSNDTLLMFHKDLAPTYFLRASDTSWTTGAWTLNNIPSHRFTTTATTTTCAIENSTGGNIDFSTWADGNTYVGRATAGAATFAAGDVGRYIRGAAGGYAKITAYTDTTHVVINILTAFMEDIGSTLSVMAAGEWWFEEPVWSASKGYPRCGTFYQGRLWMASTAGIPTGIWASKVNDEQDFANWIVDFADYGLFLIAKDAKTAFHSAHVGRHVSFFSTEAGVYISTPSDEPPVPTNVAIRPLSGSFGAKAGLPVYDIGGSTVFMRNGGKSVMEGTYSFAQGSYEVANLNLLSAHVLTNPVSMAYRKQTNTDEADYLLVVNSNGTVSVLCTLRQQEINAWAICETEGEFLEVGTAGSAIYFVIRRGTKIFLEKFNDDLLVDSGVIDPGTVLTYAGSVLTYNAIPMTYLGSSNTTISGLDHLLGEEVQIIVDNTLDIAQTVTGDTITTTFSGASIQAGLNFPVVDTTSGGRVYVESMPIDLETKDSGTTIGMKKRLSEVTVMLYETSHIEVNRNSVAIRRIGIDRLDSPVPKRTENLTIKGILGWDDEINVSIAQTLPLPMTLLGMAYTIKA